MMFAWRKAHRAGRLDTGPVFGVVPAAIAAVAAEMGTQVTRGHLELVSANGRRVIVDGAVDVAALLRILRGLETL